MFVHLSEKGRLIKCEQDFQHFSQRMYDMSKEIHGEASKMNVLKSEVKGHIDTFAMRLDRVERDVEYLHNKIPDSVQVDIEDSLIEHQVKEAKLKKASVTSKGKGK